ncbi:MAG: 3-hydroxy-3-methylglutaryl-CoA reductase [Candidatus Micrarchaeota archaeon]|nr:MAG: 3-hydroxy-3-methylglutaryl-CoA reductase [Candidatus Micrarchaeota archaeon]
MNEDSITSKAREIIDKRIPFHKIEDYFNVDSNEATLIRIRALELMRGKELNSLRRFNIDMNYANNRNIENPVGTIELPIGYAGDILVNNESYSVFLATTEGRLTAGVSRGIKAINASGGVRAAIVDDGMTRDILIEFDSVLDSLKARELLERDNVKSKLIDAFNSTTSHGGLIDIHGFLIARQMHLRFKAFTGAAMGMNMVTIGAKEAAERFIEILQSNGIEARILSESGNMDTDKKPAAIDYILGRGVSVIAESLVSYEALRDILKVSEPKNIEKLNIAKNYLGSAYAGSHGFNAHVANILAAMFIAHGQDAAQIVEGSQAFTYIENIDDKNLLYISVTINSLEVGTIGGGTGLPKQKELLSYNNLYGIEDKEGVTRKRFAMLVAAVALAGELNLLAIQEELKLSHSHKTIKRDVK